MLAALNRDIMQLLFQNEVEPWYLGLQNMHIGAQARSDYRYYSFRRAKHRIIVGKNVTPKTDVGEYTVEPNGKLTLYAGDAIVLKPGFHAENGSKFHAFIWYDGCSRPRSMAPSNPEPKTQADNAALAPFDDHLFRMKKEDSTIAKLKIFPNPSKGSCTVVFPAVEGKYVVLSMSGKTVKQQRVTKREMVLRLPKGVYIIKWSNKTDLQTKKIIVL